MFGINLPKWGVIITDRIFFFDFYSTFFCSFLSYKGWNHKIAILLLHHLDFIEKT